MARIDTIIVGAGQAGLALSRCLSERGREHVLFERGRIGERWRSERWDSLRLLTPSSQSRLPGYRYRGDDPDGFMTMGEVVEFIDGFAAAIGAPVRTSTEVTSVRPSDAGYRVATTQGELACRSLVLATGACNVPSVPAVRAMFNDALDEEVVASNPFANLRLPQGRGRRDLVVLSGQELGDLADTALRTLGEYGSAFRACIIFAAYVGLRPAELFMLRWTDLDFARSPIDTRAMRRDAG